MSKPKAQNSILILATLGVYLGLVLVGATPQAVAQNDLARSGIVEDGLYPQVNFDDSVVVYLQDVESFLADLADLRLQKRLDLGSATFTVARSTQLPSVASNRAGNDTAERLVTSVKDLSPLLARYSKIFTDGYALPDCLQTRRFPELTATDSRFELDANKRDLSFSISARKATPESARELASLLPTVFEKFREQTDQSLRNRIIAATRISARNDQVFVTTRLPRAGLDPQLASDAK